MALANNRNTYHLDCGGRAVDLSTPQVMGVINVSPSSFSCVGRCSDPLQAYQLAESMVQDGAAIIDVGADPTNPYVKKPSSDQAELDCILPVLEQLVRLPVPISIDTSSPAVVTEAVKVGVSLINDVRALRKPGALAAVAKTDLPVCLMHMHDMSQTQHTMMNDGNCSDQLISTMMTFLQNRIEACLHAGIRADRIIIDPGFGGGSFGKTPAQNCYLLKRLAAFKKLPYPLLIGVSRKTLIYKTLDISIEASLPGTLAATVFAIQQGANMIRTHDVKATCDVIKMSLAIMQTTRQQEGLICE